MRERTASRTLLGSSSPSGRQDLRDVERVAVRALVQVIGIDVQPCLVDQCLNSRHGQRRHVVDPHGGARREVAEQHGKRVVRRHLIGSVRHQDEGARVDDPDRQ